jgi:hypothetical protein
MPSYTEEDVTIALNTLVNGECTSIRKAAIAFQISSSTLHDRRKKSKSRTESHVSQQLLAPIEETTLKSWIYLAANLGAPVTLQLVKILASEIQSKRRSNHDENEISPISDRWVDRFRTRHPRIKTCFSRTIDTARSTALNFSTIKSYFDNLEELLREHKYPPSVIYNVDETGFSIGSTRKSVILLEQLNQRREKKQPGRQEWITCLECVSASILARRELREKDVLLNTRKTRKKGKRVALKGKYLLTKEDILKVVRDLEGETKKKKTKKGGKKTKYILISSEEEEEESVDESA